jgi:hypothetical protein
MGVGTRSTQVTAILLTVTSWAAVLAGLWLAPPSSDQTVDLEGGGGFAAGLDVYLPALALTLVFLVVLVACARKPRSAGPLLVSLAVVGFAAWVLQQDYLLAYLPSLAFVLWIAIAIAVTGALVAAIAVFAKPRDVPEAARQSSA